MAKQPGEFLHAAKDHLQDIVDVVMDQVDVGLHYIDRENGPVDKIHVKAAKLEDWIVDHTVDWLNKGRNR